MPAKLCIRLVGYIMESREVHHTPERILQSSEHASDRDLVERRFLCFAGIGGTHGQRVATAAGTSHP
jgi:hypothetical protein